MAAPVRDRKTVLVAVTFGRLSSVGTKDDRLRGSPDLDNARRVLMPGGVGDVDALAVLGAGRVLNQQAVGEARHLPEQAKYRDKTRQTSGSPASRAIFRRCQQTNLRA